MLESIFLAMRIILYLTIWLCKSIDGKGLGLAFLG